MYSRSERDKKIAPSNVGPGYYNSTPKQKVKPAPAPFCSSAPKSTVFHPPQVPAPDSYNPSPLNTEKGGALFGKSGTRRFVESPTLSPGPAAHSKVGHAVQMKSHSPPKNRPITQPRLAHPFNPPSIPFGPSANGYHQLPSNFI
jgi:hypothetical protein